MSVLTYLVPTCGRAQYLKWALRSLEAQTAPWKVIGFDNWSSDGSGAMLEEFCRKHGGRCIHGNAFANDGGLASGQALLKAWSGDGPAAFLHDDDMCHPERTARLLESLEDNDLLLTGMWSFVEGQEETALAGEATTGTVWGCDPSVWHLGLERVIGNTTTPTAAFGARFLEVPSPEGYLSGAQDVLIWYRAAKLGLKIGYVPEPLYYYRGHPKQSSLTFYARVPDFDAEVARMFAEAAA